MVNIRTYDKALVAQLDRASASEAEGCGFDSRLAHSPSGRIEQVNLEQEIRRANKAGEK